MHLIGKDIIRFHTIYWPIFLMALGEPLPKQVFGHPWLLVGDGKMSKSLGNVIYADDLVRLFGVDAVRYYVLHEMPFANDGVLSYELICERINSDLANVLGNLVNRTIAMTKKYFGGIVPAPTAPEALDDELKAVALGLPAAVEKKMDDPARCGRHRRGIRTAAPLQQVYRRDHAVGARQGREQEGASGHGAVQSARSDPLCRC